jgi:hypothetical protein
MVYALADRGARLPVESGLESENPGISRNNQKAGRPFIEHQLEIVEFSVALELAVQRHRGIRLIHAKELIRAFPEQTRAKRNPLLPRASISHEGRTQEIGVFPTWRSALVFPMARADASSSEVDRGTMPITRSDISQKRASSERCVVSTYAVNDHERQFGWKAFRVLTITTIRNRLAAIECPSLPDRFAKSRAGIVLVRCARRTQPYRPDCVRLAGWG